MKKEPNHIIPWIALFIIFRLCTQGGLDFSVALLLFIMSIYALADISRSKGDGAILFYWCIYAGAVGAIFLWQSCMISDWVLALLSVGAICALVFLLRWIWKNLI